MKKVEIFRVNTEQRVMKYGLGCLSNQRHLGFESKLRWLRNEFKKGLNLIVFSVDSKNIGMIEYTNGDNFWRPVKAENYLMIHCLWIIHTKYHRNGYGTLLIDKCIKEAKKKKLNGVGVVTSDGPWMAGKQIFLKNGFKLTETSGRFELLVKQFKKGKLPSFINWEENQFFSKGFKMVYTNQCPMFAKCITDLKKVAEDKNVSLKFSEMKKPNEAQNAPSGYGVMNILNDGKIIADHYISSRRFENILRKATK